MAGVQTFNVRQSSLWLGNFPIGLGGCGQAGPNSAAWHTQNLDSPLTLTNGESYLAAQDHDGGTLTQYYDSDANSLQTWGNTASTYSGGVLPSPLPNLTYAIAAWGPMRWSFYCAFTSPVYPDAANVWYGSGQYGPGGTDYTPSKRASSIANCTAGNVKNGVAIDDVLGNFIRTSTIASERYTIQINDKLIDVVNLNVMEV